MNGLPFFFDFLPNYISTIVNEPKVIIVSFFFLSASNFSSAKEIYASN